MESKKYISSCRWKISRESPETPSFELASNPSTAFLFFVDPKLSCFEKGFFGISLVKSDNKPVKVTVKFWLENDKGEQFNKCSYKQCVFSKIGDKCGFGLKNDVRGLRLYRDVFAENKPLFVCCELADLTEYPKSYYEQKFHQSMWSLYKEEIHDAVVKVDGTEFKVMKAMLMAHSDVLKQMFLSGFKEAQTNTVEIKDTDKQTMKAFIKWTYTREVDEKASIEKLFITADKYQVDLLKEICVDKMLDSLRSCDVLPRLGLAIFYSNNDLKKGVLSQVVNMEKKYLVQCFANPESANKYCSDVTMYKQIMALIHTKFLAE